MFFRNENFALRLMEEMGFVVPLDRKDMFNVSNDSVMFKIQGLIRFDPYRLAKCVTNWSKDNYPNILFIMEYGIFPSSENLHLYYLMRRSYGDYQSVADAPAHEFMRFEKADLCSFLQICINNVWGGMLVNSKNRFFYFSHDEWAILRGGIEEAARTRELLETFGIQAEEIS